MRRKALTVAITLTIVLAGGFLVLRSTARRQIVTCLIINEATQPIRIAIVSVYGKEYRFQNLSPGEKGSFSFPLGADAHYSVSVEFASGKRLIRQIGYLTTGANAEDTLTILDDDVTYTIRKLQDGY